MEDAAPASTTVVLCEQAVPLLLASRKYSARTAMFDQLRDEAHPGVQV
jgi:hypothetical protein